MDDFDVWDDGWRRRLAHERRQERWHKSMVRRHDTIVVLIVVVFCALMLLIGLCNQAHSAPPPEGSDDWNVMAPYKDWVTSQHDSLGRWCCDIGDGRPVDARIAGDHWEVHITPAHFPGQPDHWAPVPEEKVTHNANPTGVPIVWLNPYTNFTVQCFAPPDGT